MHDQLRLAFACPVCRVAFLVPANINRICCPCGYTQMNGMIPGLGDRIAAGLHVSGITPARYRRFKAMLGADARCNCPKRQARLNALGRKLGL